MGDLLVGTASWTDKTLLASGWYPPKVSSAAERLGYYAERFRLVEVDATYYVPPSEQTVALWAARTPARFTFDIKAFGLLTGHPVKPRTLFKEIRPDTSKNIYLSDLDPAAVEVVWERFLTALYPLRDAGKLGAVLFQFPPWYVISRQHKQYLLECQERCRSHGLRLSVEFRHQSWLSERNQEETLDFLRSYAIPYVVVDMPQGHASSIPPLVAVTSPALSVVRFHGHSDKWTSKDIYEKFGYHYSEAELAQWAPRLQEIAQQTRETHVLMNNCYRDYAQTNAAQLADLLNAGGQGDARGASLLGGGGVGAP